MDVDAFLVVIIQAKFVQQKDWLMQCWHSDACLQVCGCSRELFLLMGSYLLEDFIASW